MKKKCSKCDRTMPVYFDIADNICDLCLRIEVLKIELEEQEEKDNK